MGKGFAQNWFGKQAPKSEQRGDRAGGGIHFL
jgi:hypothetical protein